MVWGAECRSTIASRVVDEKMEHTGDGAQFSAAESAGGPAGEVFVGGYLFWFSQVAGSLWDAD